MNSQDEDKGKVGLAMLVKQMRDNLQAHVEIAQLDARIKRAKFLALTKEGFTDAQALELCK